MSGLTIPPIALSQSAVRASVASAIRPAIDGPEGHAGAPWRREKWRSLGPGSPGEARTDSG